MTVDITDVYPPTPSGVPADLTRPSGSYRARVILVLFCLSVFAGIYLVLTVGSAYASYTFFGLLFERDSKRSHVANDLQPPGGKQSPVAQRERYSKYSKEKPVLWLLVGGTFSGLLCLFLVKGLFKHSRAGMDVRVEVTEAEQPLLFAFIRRLCQETGAPFPHRVFLVPEVNAAVSFDESLANLIFPSRKNLIIGLGLVNRLNLTEFKAVLAHEFGHFSQNSMKLGSYVYTANRVIADVVYGRDSLDDFVAAMCRTDIRIAVFAWGFSGVLWTMRKGLDLLFRGINFAHASLSRQMEYNADLVAVSVTGSDALIFALARLELASNSLGQAWTDLTAAADHKRFTRDLFYHQTRAAEYLIARRNDSKLGTVPPLPDDPAETVQVFKPEDTSVPLMWATHPTNHDREVNAKRRYVRSPIDDRSAWELFSDAAAAREAVTRRVYSTVGRTIPVELEDPEAVQAFIDAEHAETTHHPRYHGLYENRYLKPGDLAELCMSSAREDLQDPEALSAASARLLGDELQQRMESHKARNDEMDKLSRMARGTAELRGKDFEHRGARYRLTDVNRLLKEVTAELDRDFEWMHGLDRESFRVHYTMAQQLGDETRTALEDRYRFHLATQDIHAHLVAHINHVQAVLSGIAGQRQISQEQFQQALGALLGARDALRSQIETARGLYLPPLQNMTAGEALAPFLLDEPIIKGLSPDTSTLDGEWIGRFMNQIGVVIDKTTRVLFKSLGGILAVQEGIAERWSAGQVARNAPREVEVENPSSG